MSYSWKIRQSTVKSKCARWSLRFRHAWRPLMENDIFVCNTYRYFHLKYTIFHLIFLYLQCTTMFLLFPIQWKKILLDFFLYKIVFKLSLFFKSIRKSSSNLKTFWKKCFNTMHNTISSKSIFFFVFLYLIFIRKNGPNIFVEFTRARIFAGNKHVLFSLHLLIKASFVYSYLKILSMVKQLHVI